METGAVMDVQSGFRFATKDFAPSCFRSASGRDGTQKASREGGF